MKYYTLETISNGKTELINKKFASRDQAINYAFSFFEHKRFNEDLQLQDEFRIDNDKHNVEYVLDYHDRFRVNRILTAF